MNPHPIFRRRPLARAIFVLFALCGAALARAEIEFVGILATSRATQFALSDSTTGKTDWVSRGQKFAGYTVGSFDAGEDMLTLSRDGQEVRLHLKDDAKIKAARLELTGTVTLGATEKIDVERATLLFDQENLFPLKDGITYRITPRRRPDGNITYTIKVDRVLADNKTETIAAPSIIALPGSRFSFQVGDEIGFSFTPR